MLSETITDFVMDTMPLMPIGGLIAVICIVLIHAALVGDIDFQLCKSEKVNTILLVLLYFIFASIEGFCAVCIGIACELGVVGWSFVSLIILQPWAMLAAAQEIAESECDDAPHRSKMRRLLRFAPIFGVAGIFIAWLLGVIGFIWYYFCSGFLLFEDTEWWEKIIYGIASLGFLAFFIGSIALLFKK